MTDLSPAAQAVMTAWGDVIRVDNYGGRVEVPIAAALQAAADQVISSLPPPCEDFDEYAQGFRAAHVKYRNEFLAIAAELEGQ